MTPVLRYADPGAAVRWLCEAFGFHAHASAQESDAHVRYVLLGLGGSFVLVRPLSDSVFDDLMVRPVSIGGGNTHVLYLAIPDPNEHCARARAAGARIELEPQDDGFGGRFYTCRDPEGHLWSFGTKAYGVAGRMPDAFELARNRPARALTVVPSVVAGRPAWRRGLRRVIGTAATVAALTAGWLLYDIYAGDLSRSGTAVTGSGQRAQDVIEQLALEQSRRVTAESASQEAVAKLAEERASAAAARQAVQRAEAELARERREKEDAAKGMLASARMLGDQKAETARERKEKEETANALATAQELLAEQKSAREKALAEAAAVRAQLAKEQAQKAAAATAAAADAAALREQIAQLEQNRRSQHDQLEAAYNTLRSVRGEIESLRRAQQSAERENKRAESNEAPTAAAVVAPPASSAPAADRPGTPCTLAVQGKVPSAPQGSHEWSEFSLERLCRNAETSIEPAKCFEELMRGKVRWGTGSIWTPSNALTLCAGTHSARQTLDCFTAGIAANETWLVAIRKCKSSK